MQICLKKVVNRVTFKFNQNMFSSLLLPKLWNCLDAQNKYDDNVCQLEISEIILVHCNHVNNCYQHDLRVLYTFVSNELFRQLLEISPSKMTF